MAKDDCKMLVCDVCGTNALIGVEAENKGIWFAKLPEGWLIGFTHGARSFVACSESCAHSWAAGYYGGGDRE